MFMLHNVPQKARKAVDGKTLPSQKKENLIAAVSLSQDKIGHVEQNKNVSSVQGMVPQK